MTDNMSFSVAFKAALIPAILLAVGAGFGSVCAGRISPEEGADLSAYMNGFFGNLSSGGETLSSSLKQYIFLWLAVALSGFFLPGFLINLFFVSKKGFITGYTAACFYKLYGVKGALACLSVLPELFVFLPALLMLSSYSMKLSLMRRENRKLYIKAYAVVLIISFAVFCLSSALQGFTTPALLKLISARIS